MIKAAANVISEDLESSEKAANRKAARIIKYAKQLAKALAETLEYEGETDAQTLAYNLAGAVRSFNRDMQYTFEDMEKARNFAMATRNAIETLLDAMGEA